MSEMNELQRELAELSDTLVKRIDVCEQACSNGVNSRCDALEDSIKQYINSTVFSYIDNMMKHIVESTTRGNAAIHEQIPDIHINQQNSETKDVPSTTPNASLDIPITTTSASDDRSMITQHDLHHDNVTTTMPNTTEHPCRLRSADGNSPKHDVCISGLHIDTTDDDIRAHLLDIGVSSISLIRKIPENSRNSVAFRIHINDETIKHNVFNMKHYKSGGILVQPFRYYNKEAPANILRNRDRTTVGPSERFKSDTTSGTIPRMNRNNHTRQRYQHRSDDRRGQPPSTNQNRQQDVEQYLPHVTTPPQVFSPPSEHRLIQHEQYFPYPQPLAQHSHQPYHSVPVHQLPNPQRPIQQYNQPHTHRINYQTIQPRPEYHVPQPLYQPNYAMAHNDYCTQTFQQQ